MEDADWTAEGARVIGMYLNGNGIAGVNATGEPIHDDHVLLYFNGGPDDVEITLPPREYAATWARVIDTAADAPADAPYPAGGRYCLAGRSVLVLIEHAEPEPQQELSAAASVAAQTGRPR